MNRKKTLTAVSVFLAFFIALGASAHAADISGTVYQFGTTTPIQGVTVVAFNAPYPGGCGMWFTSSTPTDANGDYTLTGLVGGTEYVIYADASQTSHAADTGCLPYVDSYYRSDYVTEPNCSGADILTPGSGLFDKDFYLADGYVISGNVQTEGGESLPIEDVPMSFSTGDPCNAFWYNS